MDAEQWKKEGNTAFKNNEFKEAIRCYKAGLKIPADKEVMFFLHLNCAAGYLAMRKFKKALAAAWKASALSAPHPKCLYRMGCALKNLGDHKGAVIEFERALPLCTGDEHGDVMKELQSTIDTIRTYTTSTTVCGGESPAYQLAQSEEEGRYYVAARTIKKGELIMEEDAYAFMPAIEEGIQSKRRHCFFCLSKLEQSKNECMVPCAGCGLYYCNEECRKRNCLRHAVECNGMSTLFNSEIVLLELARDAGVEGTCYFTSLLDLRIALRKHLEGSPYAAAQQFDGLRKLYHERTGDTRSTVLVKRVMEKSFPTVEMLSESTLQDLRYKTTFNAIGLGDNAGTGLYIHASMFNHSCRPNVYHAHIRDGRITIHAIEDISKGEKLTISYLE